MKKILLVSDSHGYFGQEIYIHSKEVDQVWHAGDIGDKNWHKRLPAEVDFRAVYGNIDDSETRLLYKETINFSVEEVSVLITHIASTPPNYTSKIRRLLSTHKPNLLICGHSHILKVKHISKYDILHVNPGAIGNIGFHKVRTMIKFTLDKGKCKDLIVMEYKR